VTDIAPAVPFFYAEHYHQPSLARNINRHRGLGGTGLPRRIRMALADG
jgi:hypothetical protein